MTAARCVTPADDRLPFAFLDQQRQPAHRPGALARLAMHAIGHADIAHVPFGGRQRALDVVGFEQIEELPPGSARPDRPVRSNSSGTPGSGA